MYKVVRSSEGMVRQIAETYRATNLITKDISPNVSLAVTEASNHHETEITLYDRLYLVLEGAVELTFDSETVQLKPGDSCFIGKDTEYEISGTFKTVIVNQPAFGTEANKMKLYRFSPIQKEDQLRRAATYVAEQITVLCNKVIGKNLPITYLTICTHYEYEYQALLKLLPELGEVRDANNGLKVKLERPIETKDNSINELRIRKPDLYRMQVGCGDFAVDNYQVFKEEAISKHPQNLRVIERSEYEMIEFYDPDFDVLAYIVSD
jgi:mannose-6-phosphate isomerase-like protein (cupin superfamily)